MTRLFTDRFIGHKAANVKLCSDQNISVEVPATGGSFMYDLTDADKNMWVKNDYLVADIYHQCHDVLVLIFKFTQSDGKYISIHFGILPHVKTRLCLPLEALNGEKLFLDRYPGILQTVLRGDSFISREKINSFIIETIPSTENRKFELENIHLRQDEPSFEYEKQAYIDELGQLNGRDWDGKIESIEVLQEKLEQELKNYQETSLTDDSFSKYGGWKKLSFEATGYFRTEYDGENWWFVDPDGFANYSLGIDCITPNSAMYTKGMEHLVSWLPEKEGKYSDAWQHHNFDYGIANMIKVFGSNWYEKWVELNIARLKDWKVNTIGNWSQEKFIKQANIPYVYPMHSFPSTKANIYRDFPDVFSDEYEKSAIAFSKQLKPLREDKFLIGYFMRNEPHWAFVDGLNLTELMLLQSHPFESKKQFITNLKEKYSKIDELNNAWETDFDTFTDLMDPDRINLKNTTEQQLDFAEFNRKLIRRYVEIPAKLCKEADPNHLNLGMRYAWIANDDMLAGCELFDVFSINSYSVAPNSKQINDLSTKLNMPVMIGEFHFGSADVGMLAYGIRAVQTQYERGLAYRYYVEQAAKIPGLIGVHYFQYNDQSSLGRFDGENYQIGVVDVCQQPYKDFVTQMRLAHDRVYHIRTGILEPLAKPPKEIPKTGF